MSTLSKIIHKLRATLYFYYFFKVQKFTLQDQGLKAEKSKKSKNAKIRHYESVLNPKNFAGVK